MSTIATLAAADALEPTSRGNINTNFSNLNTDKIEVGGVNGTPARGDLLVGKNASPVWGKLTLGSSGKILASDGTDLGYVTLASLSIVTYTGTETLTNKRITSRVVSMADATSFTPTGDTADVNTQANTQAVGALTANAPSGTPTDGQKLIIRLKSTNVQTISWNAIYRGSTTISLPTTSTGSSKTDYFGFIYNAADTKWDCVSVDYGH